MEVGFEQPSYNVVEGVGQFNVCVVVTVPPNAVPLERTFFLSVSTTPGTAGMYVSQPVIFFTIYSISLIRRRGYYLFHCLFCAANIRGWLLFEGGYYSRAAFISLESMGTSTTAG